MSSIQSSMTSSMASFSSKRPLGTGVARPTIAFIMLPKPPRRPPAPLGLRLAGFLIFFFSTGSMLGSGSALLRRPFFSSRRCFSSRRRSSISASFASSIMSCMACTCPFTNCSCFSGVADSPGRSKSSEKDNKSLGIWYLMKSCMRSCVNLISLVRLSSGSFKSCSSCGFTWITRIPKSVLSSCIARKALAKALCSGDKDSMASLNSFGVGMVDKSSGICSSSLFCSSMANLGSKDVAEITLPTITMKELNCRALDTRDSCAVLCPEN
mmetsp:Transcript_51265/g.81947  ORF Transcript_51265/g.81947 Transcript_51265/m.81947 type:complete len:268 (+) Transcript_51265:759-1562(+)